MAAQLDRFMGVFTALITPFQKGQVDFESLGRLIKAQQQQGVDGFVINGTTGESPTLTKAEVTAIYKFVREQVGSKTPLILGTGSNSTEATIENCQLAQELGADAALVVVPYYNKPPQRGLEAHFKKVADFSKVPIILYNVPGRTITSLSIETILSLSQHKNIIGIKEASGNIEVAKALSEKTEDFLILSGDDGSYVDFLRVGGHGVISVSSHIIGREMKQWTQAIHSDLEAQIDDQKFAPFLKMLGAESNPIPLKMALYLQKVIDSPELRLPLMTLNEDDSQALKMELKNLELLP